MERSFVKPYLCTHHVPNHSRWRKYKALTKEGFRIILVKTFEVNYHLSFSCVFFALFLYFDVQRAFVSFRFACPTTQNCLI
jgi:hypothetical protein